MGLTFSTFLLLWEVKCVIKSPKLCWRSIGMVPYIFLTEVLWVCLLFGILFIPKFFSISSQFHWNWTAWWNLNNVWWSSYILRRPQNFAKSSPYFWLALHKTKVRWRFRKILLSSQNIWTLKIEIEYVLNVSLFSIYLHLQVRTL